MFGLRSSWRSRISQPLASFGVAHTDYIAETIGIDYHPVKWAQFRPEIRYDHATHPNFGAQYNQRDQLSIATDVLFKF